MTFGFQLLSWRRHNHITQQVLAAKANLPRPYLSRLERDEVDPSLTTLRRLAAALDLTPGTLLDSSPPVKFLSRHALDRLARGALRPGAREHRDIPWVQMLGRALREKRAALGWVRRRFGEPRPGRPTGIHALRRLRAELGEDQWNALIRRIDKHAPFASWR